MIKSKFRQFSWSIFALFLSLSAFGQSLPSSQIYHSILQLRETKRVLYVAAHPDDENTRLIAYLANGEHAEVAYLSLTRGDGGQNLIGSELGIELGQIRTQELIKARQTDGGKQFFTRALDFGYSKDPSETLQNWEKEKVLADVVWAIRKFQPDVIITRFNTIPGVTHGHHTTSAILAGEAFDLAGKSTAFPEQLSFVKPWQPKRIFFNAYNFRGEFEPEEGKKYYAFEVGGYDPLLGKTYHQIAADSRTMHKSQGFGSTAGAGNAKDYIEQVGGESYTTTPFDGVSNRWEQLTGGKAILSQVDQLLKNFNFVQPDQNIPALLSLRKAILSLTSQEQWVKEKLEKLDQTIFNALGLEYEYIARKEIGFPGEKIKTELSITNPSQIEVGNVSFQIFDTIIRSFHRVITQVLTLTAWIITVSLTAKSVNRVSLLCQNPFVQSRLFFLRSLCFQYRSVTPSNGILVIGSYVRHQADIGISGLRDIVESRIIHDGGCRSKFFGESS